MDTAVFIEVILPLALPKQYSYAVPFEIAASIKIGQQVIVQFGRNKIYSAIVYKISQQKPDDYNPKMIEEISELVPIVTAKQIQLWEWIADYYMCTLGEVMGVALPSSLKLSSESKFLYSDVDQDVWSLFSDDEYIVAEALQANKELSLEDVQGILQKKNVYPLLQKLMEFRVCVVKEEIQQKYSPKMISFIKLNDRFQDEKQLKELFEKLEPKAKQLEVLFAYLQLSPERKKVKKSDFNANEKLSQSSINTL